MAGRVESAFTWLLERPWLLSALLCAPIYLIYACNFSFLPPGVHGTGFIQYDQPYYMANARAYFSDGNFSLTYGLPFSFDPHTPKVYFQPLTFLLGLLLYATGADPGYLYMVAGIVLAICCGRAIIACYREVVPRSDLSGFFGVVCFFWGGGLLALSGAGYGLLTGSPVTGTWYTFEPFNGWWFLNLGRNLIYTTEAFYHCVALAIILCWLRRRYLVTIALTFLLSISHPFTGLEFIAILTAAVLLEILLGGSRQTQYALGALVVLGALHLFYYLYFLPQMSAEHRIMQAQWHSGSTGVNMPIPWMTTLLSQILVAPFAIVALVRTWRRTGKIEFQQRFLVAMWVAVFCLSHHDWIIDPIQPMHFLRGYDWAALFLIGAPVLVETFDRLRLRPWGVTGLVVLAIIFVFDNAGFVAAQATVPFRKGNNFGYVLSERQSAVFKFIGGAQFRDCVVLADNDTMAYLTVTYTSVRAFYPRDAITPDAANRQKQQAEFFQTGIEPQLLADRCILAVVSAAQANVITPRLASRGYRSVFKNDDFVVMQRLTPAKTPGGAVR